MNLRANRRRRLETILPQQMRERDPPEPRGGMREKTPTIEKWMHGAVLKNK
jgi:hypothetical protein